MIELHKVIEKHLQDSRRNTGMLHCSSHLTAPIRHTQLYYSGLEPEAGYDFQSDIRLMTGTLWHEEVEKMLKGKMVMTEVDLTEYLPDPWTGRCDWLEWDASEGAFVVNDLKTIKPEGIAWLKGKPKEDHIWQVSAYAVGANQSGIPVAGWGVVHYLPLGVGADPISLEFKLIPEYDVLERMRGVYDCCLDYKDDASLLHDHPAPEPRLSFNKAMNVVDVKMVPHWTSMYCPYPSTCGCGNQKTFKVGHFTKSLNYVPRIGYREYTDKVHDSFHPDEVKARFK